MKTSLSDILFLSSKSFIYFWLLLLLVSAMGFIAGESISITNTLISFVALLILLTYIYTDFSLVLKIVLGLCFLIAISIFISLQIWDYSWDGRDYHFDAVHALYNGWNPFYQQHLNLIDKYEGRYYLLESYPKANWIFLTNNLQLFSNIDIAKYINIALFFATGFILNDFLKNDIKNKLVRCLFILSILSNPVTVGQINSLYLDGNLYLLFIIFSIALTKYFYVRNKDNFLFLIATTIILINLKFTAVVFLVVGFSLFFIADFIKTKSINLKSFLTWFTVFFIGIVFFGFSPYLTNINNHGNPLYPVLGKDKKNIISSQMNPEFLKLNRFETFFYSINSKPSFGKQYPKLENPIKIVSDINNYKFVGPDPRSNGFGPLYSISLLLSLLGILYVLYRKYPIDKYFLISIMFIIMCFSIPTTWWARLTPMMWAVPLFFGIYFFTKPDKLLKLLSVTIAFLLLTNALILAFFGLHYAYFRTKLEKQTLAQLATHKNIIAFPKQGIARPGYRTILHKLNVNNIDYKIIPYSECKAIAMFYDSMICADQK